MFGDILLVTALGQNMQSCITISVFIYLCIYLCGSCLDIALRG